MIYKDTYQQDGYYDQIGSTGAINFTTNQLGANQATATAAGAITTGKWYHIAYVRSGSSVRIYVNGVDQTSAVGTHVNPASSGENFRLGTYTANPNVALNGSMDDVAIWSTNLTAAQVQTIYARQSAKYSGQVTSRVMDALSSQSWTTLSPTTTLPFYKELPGSAGSESSSGYSSQTASLMSGIAGLWHLDEAVNTTGTNSVSESSGASNTATPSGGVTFGVQGQLGTAAQFDGTSGYLQTKQAVAITQNQMTMSAWVYKNSSGSGGRFIDFKDTSTMDSAGGSTAKLRACIYLPVSTWTCPSSTSALPVGAWVHAAAVYNGTAGTIKIYINGKLDSTTTGVANEIPYNSIMNIGAKETFGTTTFTSFWNGSVDEVAIWNRALGDGTNGTSNEVLELYRRGANRLKYQIRSCANSDCSDQQTLTTTGQGWKGPDNTQLSYFSELYNTTSNVLGGTVATGTPTMTFSNFGSLSLTSNRYVQYRAILESDDVNTLCTYNSTSAACSPELQSVSFGPNHYDTTAQSITTTASIGSAYQTLDASGFTETLGTNSCSAGTAYALSSDGTNFYYWNGSAWSISSSYTTASTAATIKANISTFPLSPAGTGTLQIETYLKSSGTSPCEVSGLQVTGRTY